MEKKTSLMSEIINKEDTESFESEGKRDDYFENFTFPESVIETKKCECEEKDCSISVSNIYLMSGVLTTDTSNLVRGV